MQLNRTVPLESFLRCVLYLDVAMNAAVRMMIGVIKEFLVVYTCDDMVDHREIRLFRLMMDDDGSSDDG
jgi:hypothetical protein